MQAIILAAGMGKRLHTDKNKSMVCVNGISLWSRQITALKKANIKKIIVVTGYNAPEFEKYILTYSDNMEITFVRNDDFATTNNIWSLFLAKDYFTDDVILLESDLIYEEDVIEKLCNEDNPNVTVVAKLDTWMDGTTVILKDNYVEEIIPKSESKKYDPNDLYKTVNIYKFSAAFLKNKYFPMLEYYIQKHGKQEYYEMALRELITHEKHLLAAMELQTKWYEIDTEVDLEQAEKLFH